jgi:hypothetical protein
VSRHSPEQTVGASVSPSGARGAKPAARVPVGPALHVELGAERVVPYPRSVLPRPANVIHVCEVADGRLAVVGSASRWECLHSLTMKESASEVLIDARIGRLATKGNRAVGFVECCTLWVVEVTLQEPLGRRAVRISQLIPS